MLNLSGIMPTPIRWGILGTGGIAGRFAAALRSLPDARLVAVGSRSRESAERFARDLGVPRACGSHAELAGHAEVEVVYVATPNSSHRDLALLCLDRGKAVVCEKPFALDAPQAREVAARARARGLFCMEAMWMRFTPAARELERLVRSGAVGEPRLVAASLGFPSAFDPHHRLFDPAQGGGALLDLGVYAVSFAHWMLGRPVSVASQAILGETGVDEQVSAVLAFPGGRQAVVAASLRARLSNDAVVSGTAGRLRVHEPIYCPEALSLVKTPSVASAGQARPRRLARLRAHPLARWAQPLLARARTRRFTHRVLGEGYAHEAAEVMRCLRAGERESPVVPLDETIAVAETLDAIRAAWGPPAAGRAQLEEG